MSKFSIVKEHKGKRVIVARELAVLEALYRVSEVIDRKIDISRDKKLIEDGERLGYANGPIGQATTATYWIEGGDGK